MTINREGIARAALGLLAVDGLDGLTMRMVATELGVRAPTLYWHVKNKQDLLDAMADLMFAEGTRGLEAPGRAESWEDWVVAQARRMRRTMLRHRDGARVFGGAYGRHPDLLRTVELTLHALSDAGIPVRSAARSFPVVLHYTVGYTIEEQARTGIAYGTDNPYESAPLGSAVDPERYPLTASVLDVLFDPDSDAGFEHGLRLIVTGIGVMGHGEGAS